MKFDYPIMLVEWEDIVSIARQPIPSVNDLDNYTLIQHSVGYCIINNKDYIVIATDYDKTHSGQEYCHNDFTIIPRGVIRKTSILKEAKVE